MLHRINNPVVSGDNVYVTWPEDENANTNYDDLFIAVSNDNGQTFNTMNLSIPNPNGPTDIDEYRESWLIPCSIRK